MSKSGPTWAELQEKLPRLLGELRAAGFDAGTDQFLDASDLLIKLAANGTPVSEQYLCNLLSGIFAASPEQQAGFRTHFLPWFQTEQAVQPALEITAPGWWWRSWDRLVRIRWLLVALLICALVGSILYVPKPIQTEIPVPPGPGPGPIVEKVTEPPVLSPQFPPRPVPAEINVPPRYDQWWAKLSRLLWLLPMSAWLAWLLRQLVRRYAVATHERSDKQPYDLSHIRLSAEYQRLFSDPELDNVWRGFRQYRSALGRELDVTRTVDELIRNHGFLEPYFRSRSVPPAYLALVDRLHSEDHVSELSSEWLNKLEREHIPVQRLYFRGDPRFTRLSQGSGFTREPGALTAIYPDHDLLLLADGTTLAEGRDGEPRDWTSRLRNFRRVWLFAPQPLWPLASVYRKLQPVLRALPLTPSGLAQMAIKGDSLAQDSPFDLPLPALISEDPSGWLQNYRRPAAQNRVLVETLRQYLGSQGYLLLCATAAYPRVYWRLTRALDQYLGLDDQTRIWRLRKIARLPWYRHGGFPLRIRRVLLRSLEPVQLREIQQIFQRLQTDAASTAVLRLPIRTPTGVHRQHSVQHDPGDRHLESTLDAAEPGEVLADPVFAQVIRGRKPRLHETELFNKKLNNPGRASIDYFLRAIVLGACLLMLAVEGNVWLWEHWLSPLSRQMALAQVRSDNSLVKVSINAVPEMQAHAANLQKALNSYGFDEVIITARTTAAANQSENGLSDTVNTMRYNLNNDALDNIKYPVHYQLYGQLLPPSEIDTSLSDATVVIDLTSVSSIFQDSLLGKNDVNEPPMKLISAGCFSMGSPSSEVDRRSNETQHEVCIEKEFEIGVYEVTNTEYRQYANATGADSVGNELEDGQRPIDGVSWNDAMGYVNWLSNQTGKNYRLPTEAEWEYAARAMEEGDPVTAFNTGNCISSEQANFDGTVAYSDCPVGIGAPDSTLPVRQFPPNRWELFDMHGNVWEWTCSAYDENYQGGELTCADMGDEGARVLRGGSWYDLPQRLRSANRSDFEPTGRFNGVGFRVARVVP